MAERIEVGPQETPDTEAIISHLKNGGSVVFEPGVEPKPKPLSEERRTVFRIPGYREGLGRAGENHKGFDPTVIGRQAK